MHKGSEDAASRVLVLTADYPPAVWSGIGTAVERQAKALARGGAGVQVMVAPRQGVAAPAPYANGRLSVRPLDPRRFLVDPASFDIVHLHSLSLAELALQIRARTGAPLVYTAHGLLGPELGAHVSAAPWRTVQDALLAAADAVVVLSASERALVCRALTELSAFGRLHVVGNSVADDRDVVMPTACLGDERHPFILFAGRFAASKGLDLLEAMWGRLAERWGGDLVIAGGHGDDEGDSVVDRLCARWPNRCRRAGWLLGPDLQVLYRAASLVVVPSRYEPFGLVGLDALALGTPVLASAVGGLAEIVVPAMGGLTLASRDPDVWAETALGIVRTPLSPEQRRRAGAAVRARYDGGALAARLRDEVYRPLLHSSRLLERAL